MKYSTNILINHSVNNPEISYTFGIQQISREISMERTHPGVAIICGLIQIDHLSRKLLLGTLPDFIVINGNTSANNDSMRTLLELLFSEAKVNAIGARAILDRLADALIFYIVRDIVEKDIPMPGLLGAFEDTQICNALLAIHENLQENWTLDKLAEKAFLSRSVFAERFMQVCGLPPIEFLTVWRMYYARRWLEQEHASVIDVAERCGYRSEASFSKAFKRVMGVGPGQFRKIGATK